MKKNFLKWSSLFTLAAMVFSGCSADATDDVVAPEGGKPKSSITVNAQFGDDTRVNAKDDSENQKFTTVWGDDDDMVVLNDKDPNECGVFTIEEHDGKTAKFTCDEFPKIDGAQYRAIYPADAWTLDDDTALSSLPILLPAEQKPTDASVIDPNAVILVSDIKTIENNTLDFKFTHVAAYVKLGLKNLIAGKIAKVVISTEETPIAGEFTYDGKTVTAAKTAVNEITVNPDITVENNGDIHEICFSMFPTELDNMRIDVTYADGTTMYKSAPNVSFKFNAGEVRLINVTLTADKGTKANPYTVTEAVALYNNSEAPEDKVWVSGTIIGYVVSSTNIKTSGIGEKENTNIALGDGSNFIPVELPAGFIREAVNLYNNPSNLGATLAVCGSISQYFTVAGLKNTTQYVLTENSDPFFMVNPNKLTFGALGETKDVTLTMYNNADEASVSVVTEGEGFSAETEGKTVKVTAEKNTAKEIRTGKLTISLGDFTATVELEQEPASDAIVFDGPQAILAQANGIYYAMSSAALSSRLNEQEVVFGDKITIEDENLLWTIEPSDDGYYIKNGDKYVTWSDGNSATMGGDQYTLTITPNGNGTYKIASATTSARLLSRNNSAKGFAFYTGTQNAELYIVPADYKIVPSLVVSPESLSFAAAGESKDVTLTVKNANIEDVKVTDGDWFKAVRKDNIITVTAEENTTGKERTGKLTITLGDINKTVTLSQGATAGEKVEVTDVIDYAFTGIVKTGNQDAYINWADKTGASGTVYAGQSYTNTKNYIQLRATSPSGIVTTKSGGKAKKIVVTWNSETTSGRILNVYVKNSPYSTAADLYNANSSGTNIGTIVYGTSTELTIDGDYEYIGLRSNSNAMYIDKIEITWVTDGSTGGGNSGEEPNPGPGTDPDEPVTPPTGDAKTVTFDFTAQGWANATAITEVPAGDITFTFSNGSNNSSKPAYYTDAKNGNAVRCYGGNTITVSGSKISEIKLTFTAGGTANKAVTANVGSYTDVSSTDNAGVGTWTGSASNVVFTVDGTSGNRRIAKVEVTYTK